MPHAAHRILYEMRNTCIVERRDLSIVCRYDTHGDATTTSPGQRSVGQRGRARIQKTARTGQASGIRGGECRKVGDGVRFKTAR